MCYYYDSPQQTLQMKMKEEKSQVIGFIFIISMAAAQSCLQTGN